MYEKIMDRWRELESLGYEPHACWREIQKEFPQDAENFFQTFVTDMFNEIEHHLKGT